jgi:hypothetical protein
MNPTASSFFVSRTGSRSNYPEDVTGAAHAQAYSEIPLQSQGQNGSRNGFGRPQYVGPTSGAAEQPWYMAVSTYGQQGFDAPYGGTPSPSHELAFRPAPAFGQSFLRNGNRQTRTGDFGQMR